MPPRRCGLRLCCWLALALLGAGTAAARTNQGTDYDSLPQFTNPANWTQVIIDKDELVNDRVTFYLNPCESVLYKTSSKQPRSCLPRPACAHLEDMEDMFIRAMAVWGNLAGDALDLFYGGVLGGIENCSQVDCEEFATDHWTADNMFVVTRTYLPGLALDPEDCPGATSDPPTEGGAAFSLFEDDPNDHTTRRILESDIVVAARKWDNDIDRCLENFSFAQCEGAWLLEIAHEIGHAIGFSHTYATRKTLEPLGSTMIGQELLVLQEGKPSIMSYDRPGSIDVYNNDNVTLNTYDKALYLQSYAVEPDPEGDFFTASGIVADCDATPDAPLYGVAVIALEVEEDGPDTLATPVHLSLTGIHPLLPGQFRLDHLLRGPTYKLIAVDARDPNQMFANGWGFDDSPGTIPGIGVKRTDDWSIENSGDGYQHEIVAAFTTGFDWKLEEQVFNGELGDYDAETICVEFD